MKISKWSIWDLIFPRTCPGCQDILVRKEGLICLRCNREVYFIKEPCCKKCGKQIDSPEKEFCYDCTKRAHSYDVGISCFLYKGRIKNAIYHFKYKNKREYADYLTAAVWQQCETRLRRWQVEVVIPVPLHKRRYRSRGYNQSQLIAQPLAEKLGVPMDTDCVTRIINTRPLKELNDKERMKSVKSAFAVAPTVPLWERVLIVDDIYTTGSTVDAMAALLKKAGVKKVFILTVCIGRGY